MSRLGLGLLALLLAGCLSTHPEAWGPSGEDPSLKRAIYTCEDRVRADRWNAAAFGGAIVPLVSLVRGPALFSQCMEAHGYTRQP